LIRVYNSAEPVPRPATHEAPEPDPRAATHEAAEPDPRAATHEAAEPDPRAATHEAAEPVKTASKAERIWWAWVAVVIVGLWVAAIHYLAGPRHAVDATPLARAHREAGRHSISKAAPMPQRPAPARALTPVSATAFGPYGSGEGDDGAEAYLAIDTNSATAWHTDWYTTARFGNLYPGTGLLVDMGRPVTITAAQITLGSYHGARLQLRIGDAPVRAELPPVARAVNAGGVVRLRLTAPAHGRYVLIWFTNLPPDPAGTFQASVYNLRLEGRG
jgi:hypothetical protein